MITEECLDKMNIGTIVDYDIFKNVEFLGRDVDGKHIFLKDTNGDKRRFYVSLFLKYCTLITNKERQDEH